MSALAGGDTVQLLGAFYSSYLACSWGEGGEDKKAQGAEGW